jgi:amphi-Trp domain-containing protein
MAATGADVATALRRLADKIDQGQLTLRQGDQEVTLAFSRQMTLEIAVEEEIKTTHR